LLLLIRATFRYDPAEGWVHDGRWKTRAQLEEAAERPGLSSRSIQKGVRTLATAGLVEVDDRGHAHYYYLRLKAPESGYTWLPTPLIDRMGDLDSTATLKVLLIIYRATWGWTSRETRGHGKDALVHRRFVQLSNAELARRTGLSRAAVITAVSVLTSDEWVERDRLDRTEAFFFSPIGNFNREESLPPSSWGKNLSSNTRARDAESGVNATESDGAQCAHRRRSHRENSPQPESNTETGKRGNPPSDGGKKTSRYPVPEGKTALYERLTGVGMSHAAAVKALYRRSEWLIESTIELYETSRQRGTVIENPGGWMNVALRETWAAKTKESPPDRSGRSRSERPLGQIFADLAKGDGWEMGDTTDGATDSTDRPAMDTEIDSQSEAAGLSRRDAIAFLEEHRLLGPDRDVTHWFDVEQGDPARFYPNERLQAWKEQNLD
jgi:DNA-binding transcriptional regulator GbsR (MarR family)